VAEPRCRLRALALLWLALAGPVEAAEPAPTDVSAAARRIYERSREQLLQVRTLLRDQGSQASVGSGFLVGADGLAITNYHVVSQVALQPQRYRLTYTLAEGRSGVLQLLAFDAVHDLALVRLVPGAGDGGAALPVLPFRPAGEPLAKGERLYSLGNPLDVGFAVVEGNYNGLVERGFYPHIFFGGALNPGMSGGPALDDQGRIIGVNVATRRDGQQVSFLVPARFAQALLEHARTAPPITEAVYPELTRQLLAHQAALTQRFLAQPWRSASHGRVRVPVPQEDFMRCWGSSSSADSKGLQFERSDCEMDTALFVNDRLSTGNLSVRHEAYDGERLGPLRFARMYSQSFHNEWFRFGRGAVTPVQCKERFVDRDGLPLRAVVCVSAYKKLPGLYNLSVLVATLDATREGVQGRFDARGVDFDAVLRLTEHYLQGYAWTGDSH
jgi:S1-C subfamily serine protease